MVVNWNICDTLIKEDTNIHLKRHKEINLKVFKSKRFKWTFLWLSKSGVNY